MKFFFFFRVRALNRCAVTDVWAILGTNFTLACPYTILAHYCELDWAAEYGVPINLVRISVGMEDEATILGWVKHALEAAEKAMELSS